MSAYLQYVPILIAKQGERRALRDLPPAARAGMIPMFVLPPRTVDSDSGQPKKTVDQHVRNIAKDIGACWRGPAFVDTLHLEGDQLGPGGHPLEILADSLAESDVEVIPSTSLGRSSRYQMAVAELERRNGQGVCFRLPPEEWPSVDDGDALRTLMGRLQIGPRRVDLILDCGNRIGKLPSLASSGFESELMSLPLAGLWRSVTVAGASAPVGMSELPRGLNSIERVEWSAYRELLVDLDARTPTFGDYGIVNPDGDKRQFSNVVNMSAALRYTRDDQWIFAKGDLARGKGSIGNKAMIAVAKRLSASPHFAGARHCPADAWIAEAAAGTSVGGATQWIQHGTLHHLVTVSEQLANLLSP